MEDGVKSAGPGTGRPPKLRTVGKEVHLATCSAVRGATAIPYDPIGDVGSNMLARGYRACRGCRPLEAMQAHGRAATGQAVQTVPPASDLLEHERAHGHRSAGQRAEAARHTFGLPFPVYVRELIAAARSEEGIRHDPVLARLIRERVETRARRRAELLGQPQEGRQA